MSLLTLIIFHTYIFSFRLTRSTAFPVSLSRAKLDFCGKTFVVLRTVFAPLFEMYSTLIFLINIVGKHYECIVWSSIFKLDSFHYSLKIFSLYFLHFGTNFSMNFFSSREYVGKNFCQTDMRPRTPMLTPDLCDQRFARWQEQSTEKDAEVCVWIPREDGKE